MGTDRRGTTNCPAAPYIEGAWMTAHQGKYYLQYAAPGTEWKSYADGTYVSDSPSGPLPIWKTVRSLISRLALSGEPDMAVCLPVGSENYWKAATNSISVRHMFERRVSFYPAGFDKDGYLYTDTYLGDYPMFLPTEKKTGFR